MFWKKKLDPDPQPQKKVGLLIPQVGMTPQEVIKMWGKPTSGVTETKQTGKGYIEDMMWFYFEPGDKSVMRGSVAFTDNVVSWVSKKHDLKDEDFDRWV